MVPCGCNLCGGCVSAFGRDIRGLRCPACGVLVDDVMRNVVLGRVGEAEADATCDTEASAKPTFCSECDEADNEPASHVCDTCSVQLCELHGPAHKKAKATKDHVVMAIGKCSQNFTRDFSGDVEMCHQHTTNPVAQCCMQCMEPLCMHCDLQKHFTECKNVKNTVEALPLLRQQLGQQCDRLSDMQREVVNARLQLETVITDSFTSEMKVKREMLLSNFGVMRQMIDDAESTALKLFDSAVSDREKMLSIHVAALELRSDHLSAAVKEYLKLVESGGCVDVTEALRWSERCELHAGWNETGSLAVDVSVSLAAVKSVVDACWAVVTEGSAADKVASGLVGVGRELAVDVLSEFESRIATLGDDLAKAQREAETLRLHFAQQKELECERERARVAAAEAEGARIREETARIEAERAIMASLPGSTVLSHVSDAVKTEFVAKLSREWLAGKRFELLYRGSRDGMMSAAFHEMCDGKGPTLVLVAGHSDEPLVCVFGGYAGKSWSSNETFKHRDARDSFLFTVVNPFGDGIVRMPVVDSSEYANRAMYCHPSRGPVFGSDGIDSLAVFTRNGATAPFDTASNCNPNPDRAFGDPLGRGDQTFTGSKHFIPIELEVWSVY